MKYVHSNIVSKDWQTLVAFYIQVFECKMILPKRTLSGDWLSKGTAVPNASIKGAHLRLPGYDKNGPTLEILEYTNIEVSPESLANQTGLGHLAFEVDDIQKVVTKALKFGAKRYGQISQKNIAGLGQLTFVYLKDPEGNIVALQNWITIETAPPQNIDTQKEVPALKDTTDTPKTQKKEVVPSASKAVKKLIAKNTVQKSKRELLEELRQDLSKSQADVALSKEEIKQQKELLKLKKKSIQPVELSEKESNYLDDFLKDTKSKEALLEELKEEMAGDHKPPEISTPSPTPKRSKKKADQVPTKNLLDSFEEAANLSIELRTKTSTKNLNLKTLSLTMKPEVIARNLRAFNNLRRPEDAEFLFIEWLRKIYKADIVPLQKQSKKDNSYTQNEEAWAITARLRDSLDHLLGRCAADPLQLAKLNLDSLALEIPDFVETYKNLQIITAAAEKLEAEFIRISYSS